MPDFSARSNEKELLDEDNLPKKELLINLLELDRVNKFLGGYGVVFKGMKKLLHPLKKETVSLLDIGSGGGDTLKRIYKKFYPKLTLILTGVDLKADCIEYSQKQAEGMPIDFIKSDYLKFFKKRKEDKFDIITTSLFCHHLNNRELVILFSWMNRQAKKGFIINDLHRHPFAYYSIKFLTTWFSKSPIIKNDAPLSVLRGFRRIELEELLQKAGIENYTIEWRWAFRWLIIVKT